MSRLKALPVHRQEMNLESFPASKVNLQEELWMFHRRRKNESFVRHHSLSLATGAILLLWIGLYAVSDDRTHLGSFFGNAIADWSGVLVTILATKYMYEKGSAESRKPPNAGLVTSAWSLVRNHSLTIFLLVTGAAWIAVYIRMDSEGKWGQVVGNIVSEWTQIFGLVLLTKKLMETRSKESNR